MLIIEALAALQYLTKKLITFSDMAEALGISRGAISNRYQKVNGRTNTLKPDEIKQLEVYFNVEIEDFVKKNSEPENTAQQTKQDKKELATLIKQTITELILENGGDELLKKILK